jgi:hypothetical protein
VRRPSRPDRPASQAGVCQSHILANFAGETRGDHRIVENVTQARVKSREPPRRNVQFVPTNRRSIAIGRTSVLAFARRAKPYRTISRSARSSAWSGGPLASSAGACRKLSRSERIARNIGGSCHHVVSGFAIAGPGRRSFPNFDMTEDARPSNSTMLA